MLSVVFVSVILSDSGNRRVVCLPVAAGCPPNENAPACCGVLNPDVSVAGLPKANCDV